MKNEIRTRSRKSGVSSTKENNVAQTVDTAAELMSRSPLLDRATAEALVAAGISGHQLEEVISAKSLSILKLRAGAFIALAEDKKAAKTPAPSKEAVVPQKVVAEPKAVEKPAPSKVVPPAKTPAPPKPAEAKTVKTPAPSKKSPFKFEVDDEILEMYGQLDEDYKKKVAAQTNRGIVKLMMTSYLKKKDSPKSEATVEAAVLSEQEEIELAGLPQDIQAKIRAYGNIGLMRIGIKRELAKINGSAYPFAKAGSKGGKKAVEIGTSAGWREVFVYYLDENRRNVTIYGINIDGSVHFNVTGHDTVIVPISRAEQFIKDRIVLSEAVIGFVRVYHDVDED